jgi:hypothetical protein
MLVVFNIYIYTHSHKICMYVCLYQKFCICHNTNELHMKMDKSKYVAWMVMVCYFILFFATYYMKCLNMLVVRLYDISQFCVHVLSGVHIKWAVLVLEAEFCCLIGWLQSLGKTAVTMFRVKKSLVKNCTGLLSVCVIIGHFEYS